MSKTAQRKQAARTQGAMDAKRGEHVRWLRHPFLREYMEGYGSVTRQRKAAIWDRYWFPSKAFRAYRAHMLMFPDRSGVKGSKWLPWINVRVGYRWVSNGRLVSTREELIEW